MQLTNYLTTDYYSFLPSEHQCVVWYCKFAYGIAGYIWFVFKIVLMIEQKLFFITDAYLTGFVAHHKTLLILILKSRTEILWYHTYLFQILKHRRDKKIIIKRMIETCC